MLLDEKPQVLLTLQELCQPQPHCHHVNFSPMATTFLSSTNLILRNNFHFESMQGLPQLIDLPAQFLECLE